MTEVLPGTPPVRRAHAANLHTLAEVLADAFYDDPVMNWVMSKPTTPALFATMIKMEFLQQQQCYLCGDAAAALWLPPGEPPQQGVLRLLQMAVAMFRQGGFTAMRRGVEAEARMKRVHPQEPHFYLAYVGSRSAARGKGLGKAVLRPVLERCDAEGLPAYLENSKDENTPFYRGLGFEPCAEPFAVGEDGPVLRPMWRKPQHR